MRVEVNIDPDERIESFEYGLRLIGERATEARPVMEDIVTKILTRNRRAFETRGAATGRYWSPLKASTVERKKRQPHIADPFAPLRDTDALMKSVSERGARYQTLIIDDDGFFLGTSHPAAPYHEAGTSEMPARPPMTIPAKHAHEYVGMINDFLYGES